MSLHAITKPHSSPGKLAEPTKSSTYPIRLLHIFYVQNPLALFLVWYQEDPVVCYDYIGINAEDSFSLLPKPGDLRTGGRRCSRLE